MRGGRIITGILALTILVSTNCFCQRSGHKRQKKEKPTVPVDTIANTTTDLGEILAFKNINKIPYYYDEHQLKAIKKYQDQKNWPSYMMPWATTSKISAFRISTKTLK